MRLLQRIGSCLCRATDDRSTQSGANHHYSFAYQPTTNGPEVELGNIKFQDGNPAVAGVNGLSPIDVASALADHLEGLERGPQNSNAVQQSAWHVREAIAWMRQQPSLGSAPAAGSDQGQGAEKA